MKVTAFSFKRMCVYATFLGVFIPVIASASPIPRARHTQIAAQTTSESYQTFQSRRLGFAIAYPNNYAVNQAEEGQGVIRLTPTSKQETQASTKPQVPSQSGNIVMATFENPNQLPPLKWAQQNTGKSHFQSRQSDYQTSEFAGQSAIRYSWCAKTCGDSVVFPSRDRNRIIVLSALYDYPSDAVRWDFSNIIGKFRFVKK